MSESHPVSGQLCTSFDLLSLLSLVLELLGLLPGEDVPAEVAVGGGLLEDGRLQLEVLDDAAGAEVEVLVDDLHELLLALGGGAVVHHGHGEGLGNADSVGNLVKNMKNNVSPTK